MFVLTFSKLVASVHRGMLGIALCLFSSSPGNSTSRRSGLCTEIRQLINQQALMKRPTPTVLVHLPSLFDLISTEDMKGPGYRI